MPNTEANTNVDHTLPGASGNEEIEETEMEAEGELNAADNQRVTAKSTEKSVDIDEAENDVQSFSATKTAGNEKPDSRINSAKVR